MQLYYYYHVCQKLLLGDFDYESSCWVTKLHIDPYSLGKVH